MFIDKRNKNKVMILKMLTKDTAFVKVISNDKKYIVDMSYLKKIS